MAKKLQRCEGAGGGVGGARGAYEEFYGLVKHSPCPGDTFRGRCEDTMLLCMLEVLFSSLSDL